jgi:hypothetical protein
MSELYECAMCHRVFEKTRPEMEAIAEMESYFGPVPESEREIICDDCYQKIHPAKHPTEVAAAKRFYSTAKGQQ